MTEQDVIALYSTPGLKKNELTRDAKKDQLGTYKLTTAERDKLLDDLYGVPHTDSALFIADPKPPLQRFVTVSCPRDGNTVTIKPIIELHPPSV